MDLENFFVKYYVEPLGKYYTLPATITYAIIFLLSIYLIYKLCEKLNLKFTEKFIFSLLPFIFLGGVIRALRDAEIIYKSVLFVSPPIYFFMFALVFSLIFISRFLARKLQKDENTMLFTFGIVLLIFHLFFVRAQSLQPFFYIVSSWSVLSFFGYILLKILKIHEKLNFLVISSQLLDACSASIAIELFGYGEQHVLSSWIMQNFGTWVFIPIKFLAALIAVFLIEKYGENENLKNYLKLIVIVLGFALGTRNTLRAFMAV